MFVEKSISTGNGIEPVFGKDKIDIDQVTTAIAEFEKTLVTPNSRFDQWLLGKNVNQRAILTTCQR